MTCSPRTAGTRFGDFHHGLSEGRSRVGNVFESLFDIDPEASEADLRDVIERCERLKSTAAAAQARAAAQWSTARRDAEAAAGVAPTRRGRGLAAEIALARRDSPKKGDQHLGLARALVHEMPHTLAALEAGVLSE